MSLSTSPTTSSTTSPTSPSVKLTFTAKKICKCPLKRTYCPILYAALYRVCEGDRASGKGADEKSELCLIGRTESKLHYASSKWAILLWETTFEVPFAIDMPQPTFRIRLFEDEGKEVGGDHDVGFVDFLLCDVLTADVMTRDFTLNTKGIIEITGAEVTSNRDNVTIRFRGSKMKKMDVFSDSDCFFKFSRCFGPDSKRLLWKSEVIDDDNDPLWNAFTRPHNELVSFANPTDASERCLLFECFDDDITTEKGMGFFKCSFDDLLSAYANQKPFILMKEKKTKEYGQIYVDDLWLHTNNKPRYADYLKAGWQTNLTMSIDFSSSCGNPKTDSWAFHRLDTTENPNQYVSAIMSVGDILTQHVTDTTKIAAFGFGANIHDVDSDFFNLNKNSDDPAVSGVQGVVDAYAAFIPDFSAAKQANLGPTIRAVTARAREQEANKRYTISVIFTAGSICDRPETREAIVAAEDAPLSIIFVGIHRPSHRFYAVDSFGGGASPYELYSDELKRRATRNLVRGVSFEDFGGAGRDVLERAVMNQIPRQFERYAEIKELPL